MSVDDQDSSSSPGDVTTGDDGGTGQGSQDEGSNKAQAEDPETESEVAATPASGGSNGGSSPFVPILIAVTLFALASVGAAMAVRHRQRRATPGGPVSPEAH